MYNIISHCGKKPINPTILPSAVEYICLPNIYPAMGKPVVLFLCPKLLSNAHIRIILINILRVDA